jgi:hypothetical protein
MLVEYFGGGQRRGISGDNVGRRGKWKAQTCAAGACDILPLRMSVARIVAPRAHLTGGSIGIIIGNGLDNPNGRIWP